MWQAAFRARSPPTLRLDALFAEETRRSSTEGKLAVTQTLCCVPRHPAEGTRARLDGLPETQKLLWSVLTAARDEVQSSGQRPAMDATAARVASDRRRSTVVPWAPVGSH
jgi:hypothetical protein